MDRERNDGDRDDCLVGNCHFMDEEEHLGGFIAVIFQTP